MLLAQPLAPNYGDQLRAGMVIPSVNTVAEADAHRLLPNGVTVLTTRVTLQSGRPEDLHAAGEAAVDAAHLLAGSRPNRIVFHCTAATTVSPSAGDLIATRIEEATGIPSFTTSQALVAALQALKARRIVMLTPYSQAINDLEVRFFEHYQVDVIDELGLNLTAQGRPMALVPPGEWFEKMLSLRNPHADVYFLSCTNIRALPIIHDLEAALNASVITSNQVMLWHLLRSSGMKAGIRGYGRLLEI